jgi:hypothetical protein
MPARVLQPGDPCYPFYGNGTVIAAFKAYLRLLLTHVNSYTGIALTDEPAILACRPLPLPCRPPVLPGAFS